MTAAVPSPLLLEYLRATPQKPGFQKLKQLSHFQPKTYGSRA